MRRLILFRHAQAEPSELGQEDRARALTDHGRKDAAKMGIYMARHALVPDRVALSPAARTQQTWKLAAAAFKPAPAAHSAEALYNATPQDIAAVIQAAPNEAGVLLVIAHNPGLHDVALTLIATGDIEARARLREKLPTSGLIVIDFAYEDWALLHPQSGRLERFVSPKWLDAAAI